MACPVEIEFAAEMSAEHGKKNKFSFLQIRPMGLEMAHEEISLESLPDERVICRCNQSLSHGRINGLRDIIMIRPDKFDRSNMVKMARQIGKYNQKMKESGRQYLLIGPGRWGSADHWLGIPVVWAEISAARVIVEAAYGDFVVTPSYGTHFFQNIISLNTGYFTVTQTYPENYIDMDWLLEQPYEDQTGGIRHIVLEKPLDIYIDGRDGKAAILKSA